MLINKGCAHHKNACEEFQPTALIFLARTRRRSITSVGRKVIACDAQKEIATQSNGEFWFLDGVGGAALRWHSRIFIQLRLHPSLPAPIVSLHCLLNFISCQVLRHVLLRFNCFSTQQELLSSCEESHHCSLSCLNFTVAIVISYFLRIPAFNWNSKNQLISKWAVNLFAVQASWTLWNKIKPKYFPTLY